MPFFNVTAKQLCLPAAPASLGFSVLHTELVSIVEGRADDSTAVALGGLPRALHRWHAWLRYRDVRLPF